MKGLHFRRLIFYVISIIVLIFIYLHFAEFEDIEKSFTTSNWYLIALAVLLQAGTYLCLALNYKFVLKIKGLAARAKELYPIMLIIQFLNQALPSGGVSGQIFFIDYLKKKGMSVAEGLARVILELTTLYLAFGFLFFICALLSIKLEPHGHPELAYFIYIFVPVATFFLLVFLVFQKSTGAGWIHRMVDRLQNKFRKGSKRESFALFLSEIRENLSVEVLRRVRGLFTLAILAHMGVLLLDILTLYILSYAVGYPISFSIVFIVFTLTQFVSMISFVPGSLGVFEGGMSLLFVGFGVPGHIALTLTLIFRALIFWLPMPIGWILYRRYERKLHIT